MPKQPLASIVMPCFNSAQYLHYSLQSIAAQIHRNIELIVVNDGSSDDSEQIIEKYIDPKTDIYIKFEKNRGLAAALNEGMRHASGDFIFRFDADDAMYTWRIHEQINFFYDNPSIDLCGTAADLMGSATGCYVSPKTGDDIRNCFLAGNPFIHPTIGFRRHLIDDGIFVYNESCATEEDYELWARLLPILSSYNVETRSIRYRIHGANNQRHPQKSIIKQKALRQFLSSWGDFPDELVMAFAEFQCCGYVTNAQFKTLKEYVHQAQEKSLPRAGWIHDSLCKARTYAEFMWMNRRPRR